MIKCKICNETMFNEESFDGYCESYIPKPLCERCGEAYATYIPETNMWTPPDVIATCDDCSEDHAKYLNCVYQDELPWYH